MKLGEIGRREPGVFAAKALLLVHLVHEHATALYATVGDLVALVVLRVADGVPVCACRRVYPSYRVRAYGEKYFAAEIDPDRGRDRQHPRQTPYINTWVNRDDTWTTRTHMCDQDGNEIRSGTRVWILPGPSG